MAADTLGDLLALSESVCKRLDGLVDELLKMPRLPDETAKVLLLWRLLLLSIAADVGRSIIRLGQLRDENHARSMRMLDRSLFEYGLRIEYYIFCPDDATKHAENLSTWWGVLLKASQAYMGIDSFTRDERRRLNEIIANMGKLEIPQIRTMLHHALTMNGYVGGHRKRRKAWILSNYYHIGSAFIHGSQGAFMDFFRKDPATGDFQFTRKSTRFTVQDTAFNTTLHLIGMLTSEEKHRQAYLGSDMYYREFELITGRWTFLEQTRAKVDFHRSK